jgi:hypothetical protein
MLPAYSVLFDKPGFEWQEIDTSNFFYAYNITGSYIF